MACDCSHGEDRGVRQSSGDHDPGVYVDLDGLSVPEPVPDVHAYLRQRRICLSRSTESLRNFVAYGRSARRGATLDYLPVRLNFENVSRCNFVRTMCAVSERPKGRCAQDMPLGWSPSRTRWGSGA